jgi:hypothetical protein
VRNGGLICCSVMSVSWITDGLSKRVALLKEVRIERSRRIGGKRGTDRKIASYWGREGSRLVSTIFVDITTKTTDVPFVSRTIKTNESISFGFDDTLDSGFNFTFDNLKEVSIIVSNLDPDQGGSTIITSKTLSTSCPGPWTIGSTIASGFVLNGFLNYDIDTGTESNTI